jgi:YD repeat-containing protein
MWRASRGTLVASFALSINMSLITPEVRADTFVSEVNFPYDIYFTPTMDRQNYTGSPYDAESKLNQALTYLYPAPAPVATCQTSAPGDNMGHHLGVYVMGNCTVTFPNGPLQLTVWGVPHCPVGMYDGPQYAGIPSFHPGYCWSWVGQCPPGSVLSGSNCVCPPGQTWLGYSCGSRKAPVTPEACTSHVINIATGNKLLRETDFSTAVEDGALRWERAFNSLFTRSDGQFMSAQWTHTFSRFVRSVDSANVYVLRQDGRMYPATSPGAPTAAGLQRWTTDGDVVDQIFANFDSTLARIGWVVVSPDGTRETYSASGTLLTIAAKNGRTLTLTYADGTAGANGGFALDTSWNPTTTAIRFGLLLRVADSFGRQLVLAYNTASRLVQVTDPAGARYRYAYDAAGNLSSIVYPDGRTKTYLYNEPSYTGSANLPNALTGIVDENGTRFASYWYNSSGQATREALWADAAQAVPVQQHIITYGANGTSTLTDPLDTPRDFGFATMLGVMHKTSQSQPGGAGCGPSSSSIAYDANANVTSRVDFNSTRTCYGNDPARNLETARVEGLASTDACPTDVAGYAPPAGTIQRKILTRWHTDWRLQTRLAGPKRITTWVYNGQVDPTSGGTAVTCAPGSAQAGGKPIAVLCRKIEQATSDETGAAGFAAAPAGSARISNWTYNQYGQMLTANGPRTDVSDVTTYTYYADTQADWMIGDLQQISNALGQVTRFTKYDRNGRVLETLDANNVKSAQTYGPRGWLTQFVVTPSGGGGSQTTLYEYDAAGQLTRVTAPDGSFVRYTYDTAHRLTQVDDSAGHRVEYTLDAIGNRTAENWRDTGGTVRKTLTRTVDALNRVQQVVGGTQ